MLRKLASSAAILVMILTAACASSKAPPASSVGPYQQTWAKSYSSTTCGDWLHTMTESQRFVFSHDVIIALKAYDQSDTYARSFVADITKGCAADSLKVAEVAAAIATMATSDFPK